MSPSSVFLPCLCALALSGALFAQDLPRIDYSQATPSQLLADAEARAEAHKGGDAPFVWLSVRHMSNTGTVDLSGDNANMIFAFLGDTGGAGASLVKVTYVAQPGNQAPRVAVSEDVNGGAGTGATMPAMDRAILKKFLAHETTFAQESQNIIRAPYLFHFGTGGAGARVSVTQASGASRRLLFDPTTLQIVQRIGF